MNFDLWLFFLISAINLSSKDCACMSRLWCFFLMPIRLSQSTVSTSFWLQMNSSLVYSYESVLNFGLIRRNSSNNSLQKLPVAVFGRFERWFRSSCYKNFYIHLSKSSWWQIILTSIWVGAISSKVFENFSSILLSTR